MTRTPCPTRSALKEGVPTLSSKCWLKNILTKAHELPD